MADEGDAAQPRLDASAASFNFNPSASAFEFKPRTVTPVAGDDGRGPTPPPGAPPAKAASLSIGGPAKAVTIGGPAKAVAHRAKAKASEDDAEGDEAAASASAAKVEKVAAKVAEVVIEDEVVDDVEDDTFDRREHLNLVFIGHVDAGKSTIGGQILFLSGMVDDRVIQKYEREAKEKNRDSWYMAYIMDTSEEERAKGKTVEVGRAHFETEKKRYTDLDAPGHKNYVPNMIAGTAQADEGVHDISAR